MNAGVSALMARLKAAERLDCGKIADAGSARKMLIQANVSSPVTALVASELPPAANDPDRWTAALHLSLCGRCGMHRTPGATRPGYCAARDDLPLAYGLLHILPDDLGENCDHYSPKG